MALYLRAGLHEAAQRLSPVHPDYPDLPIEQGFDWPRLTDCHFEQLYLVVFRSVRRPDADLDLLREYDNRAHEEALRSGGLLHYFKGDADERGHCLSFCLWESREEALKAAGGEKHGQAAGITARMYVSYDLERYTIVPGGPGEAPVFRKL